MREADSPDRPVRAVSVVIPSHNAEEMIAEVVAAVRAQERPGVTLEVIVVDDASGDDTPGRARAAGARVLSVPAQKAGGNPAAARNLGAEASSGDPIVFLDADCIPAPGWLDALLEAHDAGATVVGGALDLPDDLPASARCDYYCGWYLIHSGRSAGPVPHHPPPNLSVRRGPFLASSGFTEEAPFSYTNEERAWQAELRRRGHAIRFEPRAVAYHHNRPGWTNLLRRNYRWAYTSIPAKGTTGTARMAWMYRYPRTMMVAAFPLALAHTAYICACWIRAGVLEPLLMVPAIAFSRMAYAAGMVAGGFWWLREGRHRRADGTEGVEQLSMETSGMEDT